eukprot:TRINITY_DN6319_c0_g1_i9.p1 TRINITY_DN6319_c0_g1~~TRINITY_DN6319_c0_g1_i9.p1  ORF type:complete len:270 (+),score=81.49 TRINITY_DN6319_c0_g1_i9:65-874(+)
MCIRDSINAEYMGMYQIPPSATFSPQRPIASPAPVGYPATASPYGPRFVQPSAAVPIQQQLLYSPSQGVIASPGRVAYTADPRAIRMSPAPSLVSSLPVFSSPNSKPIDLVKSSPVPGKSTVITEQTTNLTSSARKVDLTERDVQANFAITEALVSGIGKKISENVRYATAAEAEEYYQLLPPGLRPKRSPIQIKEVPRVQTEASKPSEPIAQKIVVTNQTPQKEQPKIPNLPNREEDETEQPAPAQRREKDIDSLYYEALKRLSLIHI